MFTFVNKFVTLVNKAGHSIAYMLGEAVLGIGTTKENEIDVCHPVLSIAVISAKVDKTQ